MRRGLSRHSNKSSGNFFSPLSLFAGGVNGVWYDPSDSSTLFEDTAGTTPSPTPGGGALSVVGLMLDKSQGLALGTNVIVNPTFTTDTWWLKDAGVTISGGTANWAATAATFQIYNTGILTVGALYKVTFTITSISSGGLRAVAGSGTVGTTRTAPGTYTEYLLAVGSGTVAIQSVGASTTASVDDVSYQAVAGNHAISYNPTTARPELSARVNLLTYSEQFNNAAWNIQTNLTFTTGVTDPNGGSTAMTITATVGSGRLLQSVTTGINVTSTASIWIRRRTGTGDINWEAVGVGVGPLINVTSTWQRVTYTATVLSGSIFYYGIRIATVGDAVDIAFGDIRPTNIGTSVPAYQRIADQYTYDSSGFPRYLVFNGTASGMYTPANLNLSGTDKATVFAGVRKLSDATYPTITELSASAALNLGTFAIFAGGNINAPQYPVYLLGTTTTGYEPGTYTAPISNVLTVSFDIGGAARANEIVPRINGVLNQTNPVGTANAGTGNFGTYPLNIGVRNAQGGAPTILFFNGNIYSLIVVGAASTAAQISSTESWINVKEGTVY